MRSGVLVDSTRRLDRVRRRRDATASLTAQEDVRDAVVDFVRRRAGQCGIVYCMTQADAEACADHLTDKLKDVGTTAHHYHAGMTQLQRRVVQAAWQQGKLDVVCATIA